jgi:prolipoprotein diacylglyceryltransferase
MEILLLLLIAAAFVFWIWMLVDCLQNEKDAGTKVGWTLFILLVGVIGAPLYYVVRRLRRRSRERG